MLTAYRGKVKIVVNKVDSLVNGGLILGNKQRGNAESIPIRTSQHPPKSGDFSG